MRRGGQGLGGRALLCAGLSLLGLLAPAVAQASWTRYAVVAGNNRGAAREEALRYAEEDARRVGALLLGPGAVSPERFVLTTGGSKQSFVDAVQGFDADLLARSEAGERTLLVVYFSGHSDGRHLQFGGELLSFGEVRALVQGSPATLKLLVVDSCQSGALTGIKGIVPLTGVEVWLGGETTARGTVIVTASSAGEVAQESPELGGSYFTHHLLWGLRGAADFDQDQVVTLSEVYQYAYRATVDGTWQTLAGRQHPTLELDLDQRGSVALTDLTVRDAALRFGPDLDGVFALLDPRSASVLAEVRKPAGQVQRLAVAAGSYWAAQRRDGRVWVQLIQLAPGAEADVVPTAMVDQTALVETTRKAASGVRRGAWQALAGYGLSSGTLGQTSAMHHLFAGARVDWGPLTLVPHLVAGQTHGVADLGGGNARSFEVRALGVEVYGLWRVEVSRLDVFAGLNVGMSWLWQRQGLEGLAQVGDETYQGPAWVLGLVGGLDVPVWAGWSAQVFGELDEWIYREAGAADPTGAFHGKVALGVGYTF